MSKRILFLAIVTLIWIPVQAQLNIEKGVFVVNSSNDTVYQADVTGMTFPNKAQLYKSVWHSKPNTQSNQLAWLYAGTSFFESEVFKLSNLDIKLSDLYALYWDYVEKARAFVANKGQLTFEQSSDSHTLLEVFGKYGIVPSEVYAGRPDDPNFKMHDKMYSEILTYLQTVKESNAWNEEICMVVVKSILNQYIGQPPTEFIWKKDNKRYTPKAFLLEALKINLSDYVEVVSSKEYPYYKRITEPPNSSWHATNQFYNLPLEAFTNIVKRSITSGNTLMLDGDISEPGVIPELHIAIIPTFDIPSQSISDNARQLRISCGATVSEHIMHLVGYNETPEGMWYLVKDTRKCTNDKNLPASDGYCYIHDDYVKLKVLAIIVNKVVLSDYLPRFTE